MINLRWLIIFVIAVTACGKPPHVDIPEGSTKPETEFANYRESSTPRRIIESDQATSPINPAKLATDHASLIRPLIDPAKLVTLEKRGANSRIQKITAILWEAKVSGQDPAKVAGKAVELIGWGGTDKGRLTAAAMVRNIKILEGLGSTTPEDLDAMKHGKAATVRKGPYAGEILSVDHVIPRAVAPELDNVVANLELMPLSVNVQKNDKIGNRQVSMAKSFHDAGLLSDAGFQRVLAAKR